MPRAEWRSQAAYEGLRSLDAPGFAWQFLNRNLDFQRDWKRLERVSEQGPLAAAELDRFAHRWGVRFRDERARPFCSAPLDGGQLAERDRYNSAPVRSCRFRPQT
jgi:Proteobacterial transcriptional regulator-like domain